MTLSNLQRLTVDRIIFATGYRTDVSQVPYLDDVISQMSAADGAPVLDTAFQSTLAGLYIPGFAATNAFGPFFGFTKACPAAALRVTGLHRRFDIFPTVSAAVAAGPVPGAPVASQPSSSTTCSGAPRPATIPDRAR